MSAFVVSKAHVDLMVSVAIHGPVEAGRPWAQYGPLRWFDCEPVTLRRGARQSKDHEAYLTYYQQHRREARPERADEIGWMLVVENLRSIRYRYPDTIENPEGTPGPIARYWEEPYRHTVRPVRLTIPEALQAIRCYDYQACEHPEWEESEAKQFCEALTSRLVNLLPGMDAAPWEWTEERIAERLQGLAERRAEIRARVQSQLDGIR